MISNKVVGLGLFKSYLNYHNIHQFCVEYLDHFSHSSFTGQSKTNSELVLLVQIKILIYAGACA